MNDEPNPSMLDRDGFAFLDQGIQEQFRTFKETCAQFANKPVKKNDAMLQKAIDTHFSAINGVINLLDDQTNSPDIINSIFTYIKDLEEKRVTFLNELDGGATPSYQTLNNVLNELQMDMLDDDLSGEESVAQDILGAYYYSFNLDLAQFRHISTARYEDRPGVRRRVIMRQVGSHALDAAKIGVGVFAGIAAAKKFRIL